MDRYINDCLSFFVLNSEFIKNEVKNCMDYWLPESPPIILLFSCVGKNLAAQLSLLSSSEKQFIFQHIEDGMCSEENELNTAVATGLIESLITASDENTKLWKEIESNLQPESKKHALAWKNFGQ